jgi:Ni,Fe-hydrogenase I cytochrome b subunit
MDNKVMNLLKTKLSLNVASLSQQFHNPLCHALKMTFPSPIVLMSVNGFLGFSRCGPNALLARYFLWAK